MVAVVKRAYARQHLLFFFFFAFPLSHLHPPFFPPPFSFLEHKQLHTATHARAFRKVL